MATVIKKISELENLEELTSASNVIIEENGEAKRFSAQNIGKVKTVNGIQPDENGNIEVEVGSGGSGVSAQPDWNQNDESAADYVKNRTHYITITDKELLPETLFSNDDEGCAVVDYVDFEGINTATVTYDGKEYVCEVKKETNPNSYMYYLGNRTLGWGGEGAPDTGEPFYVEQWCELFEGEWDRSTVVCAADDSSHTVKIVCAVEDVKKIDENYIPDTIARVSDVEELRSLVGDTSVSEQITEALEGYTGGNTGTSIQSDYNQNDPTAADYIKNRTHWMETSNVVVVEVNNAEFPSFAPTGIIDIGDYGHLKIGSKYDVVWDGVPYYGLVAFDDGGYPTIGSPNDGGKDIDGPFCIFTEKNSNTGVVYLFARTSFSGSVSYHSFTVSEVVEVCSPLDDVYIPDTIARKGDICWNDLTDQPFGFDTLYNFTLDNAIDAIYYDDGTLKYAKFSNESVEPSVFVGRRYKLYDEYGVEVKTGRLASYHTSSSYPDCYGVDVDINSHEDDDGVMHVVEGTIIIVPNDDTTVTGSTLSKGIWVDDNLLDPSAYGVKSVKIIDSVKTIDEMYIPDTVARVSDLPSLSWNNLTDKPFGDGDKIYEWLPDVEYTEKADMFVKVSDDAPDKSDVIGGKLYVDMAGGGESLQQEAPIEESFVNDLGEGAFSVAEMILVVTADTFDFNGSTLTKGVWMVDFAALGAENGLTYNKIQIIVAGDTKTLDEKYIPDTIARIADIEAMLGNLNSASDKTTYVKWNVNGEYESAPDPAGDALVKLSETVPSVNSIIGATFVVTLAVDGQTITESTVITSDMVVETDYGYVYGYNEDSCLYFVTAESATIADTVLTQGVWSQNLAKISGYVGFEIFKKFVTSVNGMTGDVVIEGGSGGGVTSWNDLEDKPFGEEGSGATIEWDGNTEGLESAAAFTSLYKMSGATPTQTELTGGVLGAVDPDNNNEYIEVELTDEKFASVSDFECINCLFVGQFIVAYDTEISFMGTEYTLPSTGIWVMDIFRKLTYGSSTIHTLDEKFIPDTIARKTDVTWENLPDKPFGETDVTQTINMDTPSFTHYSGAYWTNSIVLEEQPGDNVKKLSVIWDDITYNDCNIVKIVRDNYIEYICGNGTIHQGIFGEHVDYKDLEEYTFEDTGESFAIRFQSNVPMLAIYAYDEEADGGTDIVTKISIEITKTISKAIDEKYIPGTIARTADIPEVNYPVTSVNGMTGDVVIEVGSGGGVTSWNDLKDKPFGEEGGLEALVENESPEIQNDHGLAQCETLIIPLVAGEKYKVILDGMEYQFTATEGELHGNQFVYIGSEQMFNDINAGTNGDFFIASVWEDGQCVHTMLIYYTDNTTITLSVYKDATVIHPLDEKFIPDTIARATDIPEVNYPVTSVNGMMGDVVVNTFSGSWNDLTDKPSPKASGVITWDCSTEDRESFVMNEMITYYRVADLPSDNLTITRSENSNGGYNDSTESIFKAVEGEGCTQYNCNYILLVYSENFTFGDTSHTASPGVYFAKMTYSGNTCYTTSATYECPVPDATGETVTAAEFNALLAALREAGYLAT